MRVELNIIIEDVENNNHALHNLIAGLEAIQKGGNSPFVKDDPKPKIEPEQLTEAKKPTTKAKKHDVPNVEVVEVTATKVPDNVIHLNDIKLMLKEKVTDHRPAIHAKLKEYGAKNLAVLDSAHYADFYEYMAAL